MQRFNFAEKPWQLSEKELFRQLNSSINGISDIEAKERLDFFGKNELIEKDRKTLISIFLSQFESPLTYILFFAGLIAFFLGEQIEAIVILAIVALNGLLGFFQEFKSEKALQSLKKLVSFNAVVQRNGVKKEIDSSEITVGDIVLIQAGDKIPADLRILECEDFSADESTLTGESIGVEKNTVLKNFSNPQPNEISNMAFMGTIVLTGHAIGISVSIGEKTFLGKTAVILSAKVPKTSFEASIRDFGNMLLKITLIMTVFVFLANAFLGKNLLVSFLFALALAVGITPEALPMIITIALSTGALELAKKKVIVKKLVVIENLGNMDILCADKTGTLSENKLFLEKIVSIDSKNSEKLLEYSILCNSLHGTAGKIRFGNLFDEAIMEYAAQKMQKVNLEKLSEIKLLDSMDFDFKRRRMGIVFKTENGFLMVSKGAVESVFGICSKKLVNGKEIPLTESDKNAFIEFESKGYSVLAIAFKKIEKLKNFSTADEKDLTLAGFLLFGSIPRKTSIHTISELKNLGVELKILTGDSAIATQKLCSDIGFQVAGQKIVLGAELEKLAESEFAELAGKFNVFCRITPEQKTKIVLALRKKGHTVGFMGDGVNDAPALRAADVGISVNNAVDVAKDAAHIILLNKSLESILTGIKIGRKTFGNITKYILNTISANFGNMFTIALSSLALKFIPLLPSQILLNNFLSDVPLTTVSTDNVQESFLKKPKKFNLQLISKFMVEFGLLSFVFDLLTIGLLVFWLQAPTDSFRTAWFLESVLSEIIVTFAIRTQKPFYKSNPSILLAATSILAAAVGVAIIYSSLANAFGFIPLGIEYLLMIAVVVSLYFASAEILKQSFFKKNPL